MNISSGVIWIKLASIYIVIGISLGIYMGVKEDFNLHPVHAHLNLLGWVSLALIGLIYRQFPKIASSKLAKAQFWMHNIGLPFQMLFLSILLSGNVAVVPLLGIADIVVGLSFVLFLVNVFSNLQE